HAKRIRFGDNTNHRIHVKRAPFAATTLSRHVVSLRQSSRARYDRPMGRICRWRGGYASNAKGGLSIGIASNTTLALSIFLTANIADYEEPPPTTIDFDIDEAPAPYASEQSAEIAEYRRTIDEKDA